MKRTLLLATIVFSIGAFAQTPAPVRPKITGIDHVAFYTTSDRATRHLYSDVLGLPTVRPFEARQTLRFLVGVQYPAQWIGYSPAVDRNATNRMDHVAFRTDNCAALRDYLSANGVKVPSTVPIRKDNSSEFTVSDPEGHKIEFVQLGSAPDILPRTNPPVKTGPISNHIIHAGFVVHDRAAEDHFYKDILGFRPYWHGGMQNDRDDWVALQVPDGTDWVEYMLNIKPDADQRTIGVMNHVSLGVKDIKSAQATLEGRGWKPNDREHAQMGRDGKWQLNLYDPDQTRIELMEFTPAEKPCCSEFQGPHPSE